MPDLPSAQVVLLPASGRPLGPDTVITAANVHEFAPSREAAAAARLAFERMGFDVGPLVGISFSITAPAETFEEAFGVTLERSERGGLRADGGEELPLAALPEALTRTVHAVTFVPPPDFGPVDF